MSWPAGVTTRTVTLSDGVRFEDGDPLEVDTVTVSADRDLVWDATGEPLLHMLTDVSSPFELPVTDQTGWLFHGVPVDVTDGNQSHTYTVRVTYTGSAKQFYTIGPFVLPEDDGSDVDLDKIVSVCPTVGPGPIQIPDISDELASLQAQIDAITASDVESVNGLTGVVVVGLVEDPPDSGFYELQTSN